MLLEWRLRGFAYEPRGLAQNLITVIALLPWIPLPRWRYAFAPVFILFGLTYTFSASSILMLAGGCLGLLLYFSSFERGLIKQNLKKVSVITSALALVGSMMFYFLPENKKEYMAIRFRDLANPKIAEKLEVFDAAAVNFLNHHPKYYILGTGPGLIYLPATEYVIKRDQPLWGGGFQALPHMGMILMISNAGLIGLFLFGLAVWIGIRQKSKEQLMLNHLGILLTSMYFFQIRYFFVFGLACLFARAPQHRYLTKNRA